MKTKARSIKTTPTGKYSRKVVRMLVKAVHVLETEPDGEWEVRTLGVKGDSKRFEAKGPAIEYALQLKGHGKVIVHQREPKKVTVASARGAGNRLTIREPSFSINLSSTPAYQNPVRVCLRGHRLQFRVLVSIYLVNERACYLS
jgi:hypothetical protein